MVHVGDVMMFNRETILLTAILSLSIGSGGLWYMRERASRSIPKAPSDLLLEDQVVVANADIAPRLDFDTGVSTSGARAGRAAGESGSVEWQPEERAAGARPEVGAEPEAVQLPNMSTLTVEDILAYMEADDQEMLQALLQALIADGNASLPLLDAMLHSGRWRAERMAIMALSQIETTEARLTGLSRLLTRGESVQRRGWHSLASMMGRNLNGEMVDLLAGMAEDAEGDALRSIYTVMRYIRNEDGLFRLYMLGEEHENADIRRMAMHAVFRGRGSASVPLLQDIMLGHEDPSMAERAARSLAQGGRVDGLAFLAETASNNQPESELAMRALEQARHPRSQRVLSDIASGNDYTVDVRLAAVRALGNSAHPRRATRYLTHLASNADTPVVRRTASELLEARTQ